MKKILLITLIIPSFAFASGMRFTMEKDRKVENRQINAKTEKSVNKNDADTTPLLRNYEIGDGNIKSTKEKVNTNLKLTGSKSNKHAMLNRALNKLVNESSTYLGIPYLWGGTTRKGLDCSAFVKNVYSSIGIILPRVSRDQAKVGKRVSLAAARKGDLIFFETDPKRPDTVSHVGMYIGNGKMIHASSGSEKVVIVPLNQGYFMSKMVAVKRIVDIS
ncbi:MAG: C40 family peptidase [Leptotrichiaceae bacterium]|nr:C40 family peptidase [Leptotrichiaceae bacterium]